jgi:hypothetical protein
MYSLEEVESGLAEPCKEDGSCVKCGASPVCSGIVNFIEPWNGNEQDDPEESER